MCATKLNCGKHYTIIVIIHQIPKVSIWTSLLFLVGAYKHGENTACKKRMRSKWDSIANICSR